MKDSDGNKELRYVFIKVSAKGTPFRPYNELNPLYNKWKALINQSKTDLPEGLNRSRQTAGFHWCWMISERAFLTNAI